MPDTMSAPAQPKLPTPRNLPFQPATGNQTSTLKAESLLGLSMAATRQNAGFGASAAWPATFIPGWPMICDSGSSGIWYCPAATSSAAVTVASGSASLASSPQDTTGEAACAAKGSAMTNRPTPTTCRILDHRMTDRTPPLQQYRIFIAAH